MYFSWPHPPWLVEAADNRGFTRSGALQCSVEAAVCISPGRTHFGWLRLLIIGDSLDLGSGFVLGENFNRQYLSIAV